MLTPTTPATVPVPNPVPPTAQVPPVVPPTAPVPAVVPPTAPTTPPEAPVEPEVAPEAPIDANKDRIATIILCYAVGAYAYKSAYVDTVNNIKNTPTGDGIFDLIPANLVKFLEDDDSPENLEKGKKILGSKSTTSMETEIRSAVQQRKTEFSQPILSITILLIAEPEDWRIVSSPIPSQAEHT